MNILFRFELLNLTYPRKRLLDNFFSSSGPVVAQKDEAESRHVFGLAVV